MNNGKNVLWDKSYAFALKIVQMYKEIVEQKKEYVLSRQILRSIYWRNGQGIRICTV